MFEKVIWAVDHSNTNNIALLLVEQQQKGFPKPFTFCTMSKSSELGGFQAPEVFAVMWISHTCLHTCSAARRHVLTKEC